MGAGRSRVVQAKGRGVLLHLWSKRDVAACVFYRAVRNTDSTPELQHPPGSTVISMPSSSTQAVRRRLSPAAVGRSGRPGR